MHQSRFILSDGRCEAQLMARQVRREIVIFSLIEVAQNKLGEPADQRAGDENLFPERFERRHGRLRPRLDSIANLAADPH